MSYVVFARRYRPKNFDEIIGQEHITRTIKNAIRENRVAHAYLFSGPRGVGKTTTARILAKALNCRQGPIEEPCDKCSNCLEITQGSSIDVQEIDGASNRGIDEIRSLRENVKFSPATSKYKIYIIDEAHQITDAAFNALLKTLEEPPEHVIFILATTEPQKIPVTILSRCQRYRFRLLSSKEIVSSLEKIIKIEGFNVDSEALNVITNAAAGSLRDALSLLDQAVSFVSGKVKLSDIQNLLGFLPQEIIYSTSELIAKNDYSDLLKIINHVTEQGFSLLQFARELREHFRRLLLIKINPEVLDVTSDEKINLEKQKDLFSQGWLIRTGRILSKALDEMRWSDQPRLILESYIIRIATPYESIEELLMRLEKLEQNVKLTNAEFNNDIPPAKPIIKQDSVAYEKLNEIKGDQLEKQRKVIDKDNLFLNWQDIVSEIKQERPRIGNILSEAKVKEVNNCSILVSVSNKFSQEGIVRNQQLIEEFMNRKFAKQYNLQVCIEQNTIQDSSNGKDEEIIVQEEQEMNGSSVKEVFEVREDLTETKQSLPQGLEKILNKFPGKVNKKK